MVQSKYLYGIIYTNQRTLKGNYKFLGKFDHFEACRDKFVELYHNQGIHNIRIIRRIHGTWSEDTFEVCERKDRMELKGDYDYIY
jgi:hypothetical protein